MTGNKVATVKRYEDQDSEMNAVPRQSLLTTRPSRNVAIVHDAIDGKKYHNNTNPYGTR